MTQEPDSNIEIRPVNGPVDFCIRPPGSKSITNRVLLCAAFSQGTSYLEGVLDSDDTGVMIDCLGKCGVPISSEDDSRIRIEGCSGRLPVSTASLSVRNSGTTIRFLTAVLGIHGGHYRLSGIERMHQRPIGPLVDALNALGASARTMSPGSCPPVMIENGPVPGGTVEMAGDMSSQYLSGMMMAAPLARQGLRISLAGELVSRPYVAMTQAVMASFGVRSELELDKTPVVFSVAPGQQYRACNYTIEPDASAASYFWATAAICGGRATVAGLNRDSLQGDVNFVRCLEQMGCNVEFALDRITVRGQAKHGIDVDMSEISDTVQTLATVALFVKGPTTVRGVAHNRVKETDRIGNLAIELRKVGVAVHEHADGLTIEPAPLNPAVLRTYDDHRMAMSFALIGLRQPGIVVSDPGCTSKTYPGFFEDLNIVYPDTRPGAPLADSAS